MADNLSINDVTIGYSITGSQQYLADLNAKAIIETQEKLAQIDGIKTALEAGWIGIAQLNYVQNLMKSVVETQRTLEILKRILDGQFAEIEEAWREQDKNIVPLE